MTSERELLGPVRQVAYVVADVEAAARTWVDRYGIGPWRIRSGFALSPCLYRGREIDIELTIASSYSAGLEIELMTQTAGPASMYSDFMEQRGPGAQHVCFFPPDYDAAHDHLVRGGLEVVLSGVIRGTRFAYLDDAAGQVIEIADVGAEGLAVRAERADAAATWDGSDPIRRS